MGGELIGCDDQLDLWLELRSRSTGIQVCHLRISADRFDETLYVASMRYQVCNAFTDQCVTSN